MPFSVTGDLLRRWSRALGLLCHGKRRNPVRDSGARRQREGSAEVKGDLVLQTGAGRGGKVRERIVGQFGDIG